MSFRLIIFSMSFITAAGCKPEADIERDRAAAAEEAKREAEAERTKNQQLPAQVAGVGVGAKGRSFDNLDSSNPANIYAAPAKAFFATKEKVVFELQIPQLMNLYKATNGHFPKSHDAFMNELNANGVKLPALPVGRVYRYRPDEGQLYVEPEK